MLDFGRICIGFVVNTAIEFLSEIILIYGYVLDIALDSSCMADMSFLLYSSSITAISKNLASASSSNKPDEEIMQCPENPKLALLQLPE
jgi:hypothetical protein